MTQFMMAQFMMTKPSRLSALLILLTIVSSGCRAQPAIQSAFQPAGQPDANAPALMDLATFPRSEVRIASSQGTQQFDVWLADTPARETQGLMFVRDLPPGQGMLFVNDVPRPMSMWMKNTYIPLDMLFIDARGRIVRIFAGTTPHSLDILADPAPVKAVLELRGGECAARGIRIGDRVQHQAFQDGHRSRPRRPLPVESR